MKFVERGLSVLLDDFPQGAWMECKCCGREDHVVASEGNQLYKVLATTPFSNVQAAKYSATF